MQVQEELKTGENKTANPPRAENGQYLPGVAYPAPKIKLVGDAYKAILDRHGAEALAERVYCDALTAKNPRDRLAAIQEITDRVEGKAVQSLRVEQALDGQTAKVLAELASRLMPVIDVPNRPLLGTIDPDPSDP